MSTPRVNVIVSTYNGERYIREQIDSLLAQSYENIRIYVRDDGSTDGTVRILEEYERAGKLTLRKGGNVGFAKSFFALLKMVEKGEYWSFCDQDDVWYPEKVSRAVEMLEREKLCLARSGGANRGAEAQSGGADHGADARNGGADRRADARSGDADHGADARSGHAGRDTDVSGGDMDRGSDADRRSGHVNRNADDRNRMADIPLLCCSCSREVDEDGNFLGPHDPPEGSICFRRALTGTFSEGFSMVINRSLRDAMLLCDPRRVHSHDWLAGAIALGLGKVLMDHEACADHRRLRSSVSRSSLLKRVLWFGSSLLTDGEVKDRNREFSRHFYADLGAENRKLMRLFDRERYSFGAALKKAFYPKRWRPTPGSEIAMRVLMLLGRV